VSQPGDTALRLPLNGTNGLYGIRDSRRESMMTHRLIKDYNESRDSVSMSTVAAKLLQCILALDSVVSVLASSLTLGLGLFGAPTQSPCRVRSFL
jgi:hypothetical protein